MTCLNLERFSFKHAYRTFFVMSCGEESKTHTYMSNRALDRRWVLPSQSLEAADLLQLNAPVAGRQTIFRVANIFMTSRELSAPNVSALGEIYLSRRHTAPFQTNITRLLFWTATKDPTLILHSFTIEVLLVEILAHEIADQNTPITRAEVSIPNVLFYPIIR
jgi:hypothetical protein